MPKNAKKVEKIFSCSGHEWIRFIKSEREFLKAIKKARIIITHAGSGSTSTMLRYKKKMIVVPRRKKYNEHYNDHQIDLAMVIDKERLGVAVYNVKYLEDALRKIEKMSIKFKYFKSSDLKRFKKFLKNIGSGKKVCLPITPGGHLSEAETFLDVFDNAFIVTLKRRYMQSLKNRKNIKKVYYVKDFNKNPFLNLLKSVYIVLKEKPKVIFSTGAGIAIPIIYISKLLFRSKIIYIESFAQAYHKSWSGRLIYPVADLFFVRWRSMLKVYGKKAKLLNYL